MESDMEKLGVRDAIIENVEFILGLANLAISDETQASAFKSRFEEISSEQSNFRTAQIRYEASLKIEDTKESRKLLKVQPELKQKFNDSITIIKRIYYDLSGNNDSASPKSELNRQSRKNVKLHKLSIPIFSGKLQNWSNFSDLFISLVHNNTDLSDIEKYEYLKLNLQGEALALIKHLTVDSASYNTAWEIIQAKFNVKRTIAKYHVTEILSAPACTTRSYTNLNQLVNIIREHLAALNILGLPVKEWSFLLLTMLTEKLDSQTREKYEDLIKYCSPQVLPDFDEFFTFLESELVMLQSLQGSSNQVKPFHNFVGKQKGNDKSKFSVSKHKMVPKQSSNYMIEKSIRQCFVCQASHPVSQCVQFQNKNQFERYQLIKQLGACFQCLSIHKGKQCSKPTTCQICHRPHHGLLHYDKKSTATAPPDANKKSENKPTSEVESNFQTSVYNTCIDNFTVVLPTAIAYIKNGFNELVPIRCLLDTGSQSSYITKGCATRLNLKCQPFKTEVFGLGKSELININQCTTCHIASSETSVRYLKTKALVVANISHSMPQVPICIRSLHHIKGLKLADKSWYMPANVDMLIGSDLMPLIMLPGRRKGPNNAPIAMRSIFGWVLMGKALNAEPYSQTCTRNMCGLITAPVYDDISLNKTIKSFWEIENVNTETPQLSSQEKMCEDIFVSQHTRDQTGRYSVALPFKEFPPVLGTSYNTALKCYKSLCSRLERNSETKAQYLDFMKDYLESGHMALTTSSDLSDGYFIPHHCVQKPSNITTKLRVVFNGSRQTSNKVSLNDVLLVGAPLQMDISAILIRFRLYKVALTADMRQMYRQINVIPEDRKYQRILWDFKLANEPQVYELSTVTYGLTSSPFLALRTVQQLAADEGAAFPNASKIIHTSTYVDDIIAGADSVEEAVTLQQELTNLLAKGGFSLHKWGTNNALALQSVPDHLQIQQMDELNLDKDSTIKVLGMKWDSRLDSFCYEVKSCPEQWSKRKILSTIARLFDPLGFLAPTIMVAKLIMQVLWDSQVSWDDPLPSHILEQWIKFHAQLDQLASIRIPRFIPNLGRKINLYCFADASEKGYASVIYAKHPEHNSVHLLVAKTRVAPLKRVSLPRLELCAALLTARLVQSLKTTLSDCIGDIYAFSDSMVTLEWIRAPSYKWTTFVANRVAEIQTVLPFEQWRHVKSKDNAADCASRGLLPSQLLTNTNWWSGPIWLNLPPLQWPRSRTDVSREAVLKEKSSKDIQNLCFVNENQSNFIETFSSLRTLLRVVVRIMRLARKIRCRTDNLPEHLTVLELDNALLALIRIEQKRHFSEELKAIKENKKLSRVFQKLNPFVDDNDLLRVGGRLVLAPLAYDQKHPILLPANGHLTELIIWHNHVKHCHAGPQALQGILSQRYWIISGRAVLRHNLHRCIPCFKGDPPAYAPMMGNLPSDRVTAAKSFLKVGIDYGGPFKITLARKRGARTYKAYLCLFVCFVTKAVHTELVSDLSTDQFMMALRRFLARRGRCTDIYSDCGTNFVGARHYMDAVRQFIDSREFNNDMREFCQDQLITWHFNPPTAPHMGGLWEAGIRSVKKHLYRVIGEQILTYEELNTVLTQVEALLNSRPLCPLSSDPADLTALTPGHFLVGEALVTLPLVTAPQLEMPLLRRWKLLQDACINFWKRWNRDYLHTLQQRSKWLEKPPNPIEGTLVLLKEDSSPPLRWKLARITKVLTGKDHISRVAEIQTTSGTMLRPLVKLCPLPIYNQ